MNDLKAIETDCDEIAIEINFGLLGNSAEFKISGWQNPENGFTWTSGNLSTIAFPRPEFSGRYQLECLVSPFTWKHVVPSQKLIVFVNDDEIERFELFNQVTLRFEVPWSILLKRDICLLELCLPDAARPIDVNGVPDSRFLALAFESLKVTRISSGALASGFDDHRDIALAPAIKSNENSSDTGLRDLMLMFESLGEDCEFGLVQRRCGAEPLGLLRFSSSPLPKLVAALEARFEGLGQANKIDVDLSPNGREYMISDKQFGLYYHAWVLAGEKTPEEIHAREIGRLPFLIRKLTEDLSAGSKMFVYRGMRPLGEKDVSRLAAVMRTYGPTVLLWVEQAGHGTVAGSVEELSPCLYRGYIERFAPSNNAHEFSLDAWVELCRNAIRLRQTLRAFAGY